MKTIAAVLHQMGLSQPYANSQPLELMEVDLDPPSRGEVLVRIRSVGLCHSDLSVINGTRPRPMPMALGHEAAGEIIELGPGVDEFEVGDHVVCTFVPSCGHCLPCSEGRPALCDVGAKANQQGTLLDGTSRLHFEGGTINHHLGVSGFAEHAVISTRSLVKVEKDIPFEQLALFGCAVLTGVGAVVNAAKVSLGSSVAIVGLGGVGLSAVLGAVASGAQTVFAVDINPSKLELARNLGATHVFDARDPEVILKIKQASSGGVEYAFETAGSVAAMNVAYAVTRPGGMTVTSGLPHPQEQFSIPQVTLTAEERTVKGSYLGSSVPKRDIPRFISMFRRGLLPIDRLVSQTISLNDINTGFDLLNSGAVSRVVVTL
ncbi:zinc-dependent alcohol dehydrogenase family protein [Alicyclobacillus sp. ALC3]|nr:zinc-dependent alcohol dehydrogenase family protein [Alicyclobacillus sp. ALC3]WDL97691.1 zinc-dependent alcohol dehydrogenase family protein [Alicyclobacillus sp. ALC3]